MAATLNGVRSLSPGSWNDGHGGVRVCRVDFLQDGTTSLTLDLSGVMGLAVAPFGTASLLSTGGTNVVAWLDVPLPFVVLASDGVTRVTATSMTKAGVATFTTTLTASVQYTLFAFAV